LFAKLLENASLDNADALQQRNIEIISRLTPNDAVLLEQIAAFYLEKSEWFGKKRRIFSYELDSFERKMRTLVEKYERIYLENLKNLGIVEFEILSRLNGDKMNRAFELYSKNSEFFSSFMLEEILESEKLIEMTFTGISLISALYPEQAAHSVE
jgi:hypothetical protein